MVMLVTDIIARTPAKLHVGQLADEIIDGLVYEHIFKQPRLCTGRTEASMRPGMRRCTECQALLDETMAIRLFEESHSHPRPVPAYTKSIGVAWSIVDVLQRHSEATQACFVLFLDLQIRLDFSLQHPLGRVRYSLQRFTFGLTPRAVCIAALQAIDVVNVDGYLAESEER